MVALPRERREGTFVKARDDFFRGRDGTFVSPRPGSQEEIFDRFLRSFLSRTIKSMSQKDGWRDEGDDVVTNCFLGRCM